MSLSNGLSNGCGRALSPSGLRGDAFSIPALTDRATDLFALAG
jgi:hypothetical protein